MKQNRFRSPVAWAAVVAVVAFVLGNYGLYDKIGLTSDTFQTLIDLLFAALIAFGVFNNPTSSDTF